MAVPMGEVFEILPFHSLLFSPPLCATALILTSSDSCGADFFPQGFKIWFPYSESVRGFATQVACLHRFQLCCAT